MNETRIELAVLLYLAAPRKKQPTLREVIAAVGDLFAVKGSRAAHVVAGIERALERVECNGDVGRQGPRLQLSRRGQQRCTKELGVRFPNRSGWARLKLYLLANALAPACRPEASLKRLSKGEDVAGLVLNQREQLFPAQAPTATKVADALAWRELGGDAKTKPTWAAARRVLLARLLGVPASTSSEALIKILAARSLGASSATRAAIEGKVLADWSGAAEIQAQRGFAQEEFAERVLMAAADPRTKRFGDNKAFIASVFDTYRRKHDGESFADFGSRLVRAHLEGALRLARADLVPAMDRDLVDRSELTYENATFHFLEVP